MKRVINTTNAPAALGPYSQAIEANGVLYVSGQIPFVPATMTLVSEDVEEQTKQSLENIDFTKINGVYDKYLGEVKPARACVEVARLPKDVKVEIGVIATK